MSEALILGAGISGLAAGWAFRRDDVAVRLLEAGERPGGKVQTRERDAFRYELGPHAVQGTPEVFELVAAAGLAGDIVAASDKLKKRFLVHRGELVAAPMGPREAWSTPLISRKGLLRAATEPFRRRGPGPHESVTRFVNRRLGPEVARLVDALALGIFAGDPDELAMGYAFPKVYRLEAEHGSLLRGALAMRKANKQDGGGAEKASKLPYLLSFPRGLASLVDRLAGELDVAYGKRVTAVAADGDGFVVRGASPGGDFELRTRRLVAALPVDVAAGVLAGLGDTEPLTRLPHAKVAVLSLGFERGQVRHPLDGFGFLAPHAEDRMLLGCLFSSTLFPDRAPEGHVALTVMAGGRRRPEEVELDDATLLDRVLYELERLLGVTGEPVLAEITRWRPGIAQATARMAEVKDAVAALETAHPGLTVLGDWLHGVGVPACIKAGWSVTPKS
jgi:oxygen-dependent protoporphyrinogen oxidase